MIKNNFEASKANNNPLNLQNEKKIVDEVDYNNLIENEGITSQKELNNSFGCSSPRCDEKVNKNNTDNISIKKLEKEERSIPGEKNKDKRLEFLFDILDLSDNFIIFKNNKISFNDVLYLSKEDLVELNINLCSRNRILKFIETYKSFGEKFTLDELKYFFKGNRHMIINQNYIQNSNLLNIGIVENVNSSNKNCKEKRNKSKEEENFNENDRGFIHHNFSTFQNNENEDKDPIIDNMKNNSSERLDDYKELNFNNTGHSSPNFKNNYNLNSFSNEKNTKDVNSERGSGRKNQANQEKNRKPNRIDFETFGESNFMQFNENENSNNFFHSLPTKTGSSNKPTAREKLINNLNVHVVDKENISSKTENDYCEDSENKLSLPNSTKYSVIRGKRAFKNFNKDFIQVNEEVNNTFYCQRLKDS